MILNHFRKFTTEVVKQSIPNKNDKAGFLYLYCLGIGVSAIAHALGRDDEEIHATENYYARAEALNEFSAEVSAYQEMRQNDFHEFKKEFNAIHKQEIFSITDQSHPIGPVATNWRQELTKYR